MRIGVIGCGTIASALVPRLARDGHEIVVSERSTDRSAALAAAHDNVMVADNAAVVASAEVVFIALLAEGANEILADLPFQANQMVISLMADVTMAELAAWVAPASPEAILLPYPNVSEPGAPVIVLGDLHMVKALLAPDNLIYRVKDEMELAAALAAQAVLSPAVAMVVEAANWLGERVEDGPAAEAFLRALVGSNLLATPCVPLLGALDTPGGYNQRLRQHMERHGTAIALQEGLDQLS